MACSCEKHSIGVLQIIAIVRIVDVDPTAASKIMVAPLRACEAQVGVLRDTRPVEFKALHLELGRGIFEVEARPARDAARRRVHPNPARAGRRG